MGGSRLIHRVPSPIPSPTPSPTQRQPQRQPQQQQQQGHVRSRTGPIFEHLNERHNRLAAWFLGPKAENTEFLRNFFNFIADRTEEARKNFQPEDPEFIDQQIQASSSFQQEIRDLDESLKELTEALSKHSIPFWSPRYNAHMTYDTSMPALLGYLMTTLFNPNNVATEASPLTTVIELEVGLQLCEMLGYDISPTSNPSARNLKFYPLSLACALEPGAPLESIRDRLMIELCTGEIKLFSELSTWELLNLKPETVFAIPERLEEEFDISSSFLTDTMNKYLIQRATKHYSWPKGAAITGIGSDNIIDIPVDINARLDSSKLDKLLQECLDEKRAVYAVVAIMGSTEHGAVDPLKDVWELREKYQKKGLSFAIHADAAWGGYFTSLLREEKKVGRGLPIDPDNKYVPELALSDHTRTQLDHLKYADSITIDPHKSGYIPYPAGGLCYRDGRMRFLVTWLNPDVYKDSDGDESVGVYGVEGSCPVAAWVSHRVIGLHKNGYGSLLGEAMFSSRRRTPEEIQKQREYIRDNIVNRPNLELVRDDKAMALVREMGSDLSINAFACNFRLANGEINKDVVESNYLNTRIYERLSDKVYGECCTRMKERLGVVGAQDLDILVNCVMSPFPTVANFTKSIADAFKKIAHEEIERCLFRNTVTEDDFRFVLQGTDKPYLTLLPMFNMANYRHQLILSCDIPAGVMDTYRAERAKDPKATFFIGTTKDVKLDSILAGSFEAMLEKGLPAKNQPPLVHHIEEDTTLLIESIYADLHAMLPISRSRMSRFSRNPIDSKYLDGAFPEYMYFYLYGTNEQRHIDHMLVSPGSAQLTSDQVQLVLTNGTLSGDNLSKGYILRLDDYHENVVFPVLPPNTPRFFKSGQKLKVSIFEDPHGTDAHGPGLTAPFSTATPVASGTMTLGDMVYTDSALLNGNPGEVEEESVNGKTLEQRLSATRRSFVAEEPKHVDPYHKRREKQVAWRHYLEENLSKIGHDTAGGGHRRSYH
ncbi:Pyridoxal-dependent decarboxylase conserved domain [Rhizoctonia solani]|uniref:Pyridoxal-dependent decarboxylase conserved domain n=1 Tax=Rhizoctonia solani TaxID=456999 RepID=A0A8H7ILR3_9AGAM|nr:Pyridoxal-dependent decarboxylase conserved domain [Rhizoctonia solani]